MSSSIQCHHRDGGKKYTLDMLHTLISQPVDEDVHSRNVTRKFSVLHSVRNGLFSYNFLM